MNDNVGINASLDPASPKATTDEVLYSGDSSHVQIIQLGFVTGAEGSKTLVKAPGDGTTGLLVNSAGPLLTSLDGKLPATAALADAIANPTLSKIGAFPHVFNGATWSRQRGNTSVIMLASAARTVQTQATLFNTQNARGGIITFAVTAAGSGTLRLYVQGVDANGVGFNMEIFAAVAGISTNVYVIYPGSAMGSVSSGITAVLSAPFPRQLDVFVVPSGATSWTYSVACDVLL